MYKYVAEIPARIGSNRVKEKNIRLLAGKPMIQYAIDACKNSEMLDDIYVNTDSDLIGDIALNSKVKYYKRDKKLAERKARRELEEEKKKDLLFLFFLADNPIAKLFPVVFWFISIRSKKHFFVYNTNLIKNDVSCKTNASTSKIVL
jgi:hypothetical protein